MPKPLQSIAPMNHSEFYDYLLASSRVSARIVDREYLRLYPVMTPGEVYQELYDMRVTPAERRTQYQHALATIRSYVRRRGRNVMLALLASDIAEVIALTPVEEATLAVLLASMRLMDESAALALCGHLAKEKQGAAS